MSSKTLLSNKEKSLLFWASFLALMAAGVGFGLRVMTMGEWISEFGISQKQAGALFGASLWPIAIGLILFSLVVDKIGYKMSMLISFACLAGSIFWSMAEESLQGVTYAFILCGFGHGIIEACINPLCATMYKKQKSKMLNILHASWPAGVAFGAICALLFGEKMEWRELFWFMLVPVILFGIAFLICRHFPKDERVEANVSYRDMLREFGGLGVFLSTTFIFYEIANQAGWFAEGGKMMGMSQLPFSACVGALAGLVSTILLGSFGKVLFFIICLLMIPLATAELGTDAWIRELMSPVLGSNLAGWAIVVSSAIMMGLRFFAGVPLKFFSPPALLVVSAIFSTVGLFLLSGATGAMIFVAFVLYAVGQTFYWPTVLGLVSEQFPKGGAMTLNTVTAVGLLTLGVFGNPFLGACGDKFNAEVVKEKAPELYALDSIKKEGQTFFFMQYDGVNSDALFKNSALLTQKGQELVVQRTLPDDPQADDYRAVAKANKEFDSLPRSEVYNEKGKTLKAEVEQNGRKVLKVAALFPLSLAIFYGLIWLWFRSRGGYRVVELTQD